MGVPVTGGHSSSPPLALPVEKKHGNINGITIWPLYKELAAIKGSKVKFSDAVGVVVSKQRPGKTRMCVLSFHNSAYCMATEATTNTSCMGI